VAEYVTAARIEDVPDEGMKQVVVRGELVGLYRVGESVYAIGDVCTHEEAYLTDGDFEADELEVECPLHGSHFNVETGEVRILPATRPVATYDVKIEGPDILVGRKRERE
jgi:3-phenylpropionate/trans-cinnamate dioxygenase ferredoxin subunit